MFLSRSQYSLFVTAFESLITTIEMQQCVLQQWEILSDIMKYDCLEFYVNVSLVIIKTNSEL